MRRYCTVKDLDKETGISTATISRYVNKPGYVDKGTAKRIEEAVIRLGYKPNRTAQVLKTKRSRQFIASDMQSLLFIYHKNGSIYCQG